MKKILLGSLLFIGSVAYAQDKYLSFPDGYVGTTNFKVHKSITEGSSYIDVTYSFDGAYIDNYKGNGKTYQKVYMPEGYLLDAKGEPELPYYSDVLALGSNKGVKVTVKSSKYKDYSSFSVKPSSGNVLPGTAGGLANESSVYKSNGLFPSSIAELAEVESLRGVPLATVKLYPVRYNPVSKTLRCYSSITYRIDFSGSASTPALSRSMADVIKNIVSNPSTVDRNQASSLKAARTATPENFLIVTTTKYRSAVEKLMKWKSMQGYNCKLICNSSYTISSLKSLLRTEYNTKVPEYLLIFGDNEDVPGIQFSISHTRTDISNPCVMYTDNLYANSTYIKGNMSVTSVTQSSANNYNFTPDIINGRISVSNATEAENVVDKIINYEKNPPLSERFYNNAVHTAYFQDNADDHGVYDGYEDMAFTRSSETSYTTVTGNTDIQVERIYTVAHHNTLPRNSFLPAEYRNSWNLWNYSSASNTKIVSAINNGVGYVLYSGHGGPSGWGSVGFSSSSISSLNNGKNLPFLFGGIACQTGMYEYASCFAETALRKSNGGAIGVTANSQYGWIPTCTYRSEDLMKCIFQDKETNVGKAMHANWFKSLSNGSDYPYKAHICLSAHLFGDPSLCIYTQEPICFSPTITKSGTSVRVRTNGVADCKITLTSLTNPGDASRMKVMVGDDVTFSGINYPYVVTIQKNNYAPYVGSATNVYIQNYTFASATEVAGTNIYAGSNVSTNPIIGSSSTGSVVVNAGPVSFKAANKVILKPGFISKPGVPFIAYIEDCMHGGAVRNSALRSSSVISDYLYLPDSEEDLYNNDDEKNAFVISPNPTTGRFSVDLGELSGSVWLYDTQGRVVGVYNAAEGVAECDLSDKPAGIYIIEVRTPDFVVNKKVVKQ
ncbi:MAG: T9SS type A sorting domain-containing protein [Paludibacteraceae bacterium]|nr:T9SS type A sorting domain-containing protein [Paludibacteraceae bacterium]